MKAEMGAGNESKNEMGAEMESKKWGAKKGSKK